MLPGNRSLAVGLVLTRRRLSRVQAELERARAEAGFHGGGGAEGRPAQTDTTVTQPAATSAERAPETGTTSDLSSEWEQAVPPKDS